MAENVDALILDLLEHVAVKERNYDDVLEAWHTSCPKLPVWEEANDRGLVTRVRANGCAVVRITPAGAALLKELRRLPLPQTR
jgi:D-3-phosphoglycerate dehydrogenase